METTYTTLRSGRTLWTVWARGRAVSFGSAETFAEAQRAANKSLSMNAR